VPSVVKLVEEMDKYIRSPSARWQAVSDAGGGVVLDFRAGNRGHGRIERALSR